LPLGALKPEASAIPAKGELACLPIARLVAAYKSGELKPHALVAAQLARIRDHNPAINALVGIEEEAAIAAAEAAESRYRSTTARPLEGITVAIKEAHRFAGRVSSAGSLTHDGRVDTNSAPIVQRLIEAGAIVLGRSITPEFMLGASTANPRHGICRNPWNPEYSPGGSSGGAAAAVAAGFVTLADGSDHGGSIRTPAACCGVTGLKPAWSRTLLGEGEQDDRCLHYGMLARSVNDLETGLRAVGAFRSGRPSAPCSVDNVAPRNPEEIRIGLCEDLGYFSVSPSLRRHFRSVGQQLTRVGTDVQRLEIKIPPTAMEAYEVHCLRATMLRFKRLRHDPLLSLYVKEYLARAEAVEARPAADFEAACDAVHRSLLPAFESCDLLLTPVTTTIGVPPTFSIANPDLAHGHGRVFWEEEWQLTWPFNMASEFPAISLPCGKTADLGLPVGAQLVAPAGCDERLLRLANMLAPVLASFDMSAQRC
jgi:Asp-tRNA(Asn)/Glu-tRNA(Gln) amidotransferase A subunit family amidase